MNQAADRDALVRERINGRSHSSKTAMTAGLDGERDKLFQHDTMGVRVVYDTGEVRFDFPTSATLAKLIERLASVGHGHGAPVSVELLIGPADPLD